MATKHHKSKSHPSRNRAPRSTPSAAIPAAESREEIIENERARLMKASAILACVTRAMEGDSVCTGNGPYWPAAIESAGELIEEAIRKLEGVRESAAVYEVVRTGDVASEPELTVH